MSKGKSRQRMRMCKFVTDSGVAAYAPIMHFCTICKKPLRPLERKFDHMTKEHPEFEIEREYRGNHYFYSHTPCKCRFSDIEYVIEHVKERRCPALYPANNVEAETRVRSGSSLSPAATKVADENKLLNNEIRNLNIRIAELEKELAERIDKHARGLKDRDRAVATAKRNQMEAERERDRLQEKLDRDVVTYTSAMHKLGEINAELEKENKVLKDRIDFLTAALAAGEEKPICGSGRVATEEPPIEESPPEEHTDECQGPEGQEEG